MRFVLHQRTIHALLDPLADQLLGLDRSLVLFLQMSQQGFPLAQLRVAQNRVLDYLVALVLGLQRGRTQIRFGGANKFAHGRIVESGLTIEIDDRRRRTLEAQRVSPGFSQS